MDLCELMDVEEGGVSCSELRSWLTNTGLRGSMVYLHGVELADQHQVTEDQMRERKKPGKNSLKLNLFKRLTWSAEDTTKMKHMLIYNPSPVISK